MKLEARAVSVRLDGTDVLRDVDFDARPGELVGLIGPNGAGKSTLLSVLATLRTPDAGSVTFDGQPAAAIGARPLSRRLAFLAQSGRIDWPLSVERVVALGRLPHGGRSTAADDDRAIRGAMEAADIARFAGRSVDTLSGGERTRVLLARALAVEADLLLADEPIAALDPFHQLQVMELLARTARAGTGVVVVLHDLTLASRFCDRLVLLHQGRKLADGAPADVLGAARIAEAYRVSAVIGEHAGARFVVPWDHIDPKV